jgi:hypothetical protein
MYFEAADVTRLTFNKLNSSEDQLQPIYWKSVELFSGCYQSKALLTHFFGQMLPNLQGMKKKDKNCNPLFYFNVKMNTYEDI